MGARRSGEAVIHGGRAILREHRVGITVLDCNLIIRTDRNRGSARFGLFGNGGYGVC